MRQSSWIRRLLPTGSSYELKGDRPLTRLDPASCPGRHDRRDFIVSSHRGWRGRSPRKATVIVLALSMWSIVTIMSGGGCHDRSVCLPQLTRHQHTHTLQRPHPHTLSHTHIYTRWLPEQYRISLATMFGRPAINAGTARLLCLPSIAGSATLRIWVSSTVHTSHSGHWRLHSVDDFGRGSSDFPQPTLSTAASLRAYGRCTKPRAVLCPSQSLWPPCSLQSSNGNARIESPQATPSLGVRCYRAAAAGTAHPIIHLRCSSIRRIRSQRSDPMFIVNGTDSPASAASQWKLPADFPRTLAVAKQPPIRDRAFVCESASLPNPKLSQCRTGTTLTGASSSSAVRRNPARNPADSSDGPETLGGSPTQPRLSAVG